MPPRRFEGVDGGVADAEARARTPDEREGVGVGRPDREVEARARALGRPHQGEALVAHESEAELGERRRSQEGTRSSGIVRSSDSIHRRTVALVCGSVGSNLG